MHVTNRGLTADVMWNGAVMTTLNAGQSYDWTVVAGSAQYTLDWRITNTNVCLPAWHAAAVRHHVHWFCTF
jgi:hypothetical protein